MNHQHVVTRKPAEHVVRAPGVLAQTQLGRGLRYPAVVTNLEHLDLMLVAESVVEAAPEGVARRHIGLQRRVSGAVSLTGTDAPV